MNLLFNKKCIIEIYAHKNALPAKFYTDGAFHALLPE